MWPFKKGKDFDAVIEGTWHDEWRHSHYKVARLEIPEKVGIVNDDIYRYEFYGVTEDFQHFARIKRKEGLEFKLDPLFFCPGIVLDKNDYHLPTACVLERPRLICVRDGRIFLDSGLLGRDDDYISAIPAMLNIAGEAFKSEDLKELYKDLKISV